MGRKGRKSMLKQKIRDFVKYNKTFFSIYQVVGNIGVKAVRLVAPVNKKKVFFISFGGRKYDDSPRSIYEKMRMMPEFKDYQFVWALNDAKIAKIPGNPKVVKPDTLKYYYHAMSSGLWITNITVERGLNFKRKANKCINTWHGTPLKKLFEDDASKDKGRFDLLCSQSEYDQEIFARRFGMKKKDILLSDLPRNDSLLNYKEEELKAVKKKLGIALDKKVILYMPTFREYDRDSSNACLFIPPMDLKKWEDQLSSDWVLLVRVHHMVAKAMQIKENNFVKNVSEYPYLSDLYSVSDCMISDYSSSFFDYAVLERPEFCFAYDYQTYCQKRGLYLDLNKDLPCTIDYNEDDLISHIQNMDYPAMCQETSTFKKKYLPYAGHATDKVIAEIKKRYICGQSK